MSEGRHERWTDAEIQRVIGLRKHGLTIREIAPLYGTNANALRQVLWRHRHGIRKGQQEEVAKTRALIVKRAEAGETNAAKIARDLGIPTQRCHKWLRRAGLDRPMREENAALVRSSNTVDSVSAM